MRKRTGAHLILIILTVVLTAASAPCFVCYGDTGSSFEYKYYKYPVMYDKALERTMNDVYNDFAGKKYDDKTMPIPGLIETRIETGGVSSSSNQYVPQGMCRAGDYMLITAYDVKKKHNSVIYAVDMNGMTLVSTLTMPNRFHAGGIACDGENIWMTGETSDKYKGDPFVQYMTYETFLGHLDEPVSEVEESELSRYIYIKNKPSFLEYDNGRLWVGTYAGRKNTSDAYMYGYEIIGEPGNRRLNTLMYSIIAGLDTSAQGADIAGDYLYVSSSYNSASRMKTSFITKYNLRRSDTGTGNYLVEGHEMKRVEVPKMNEELVIDGSTLYINFESGASHWRYALIRTDRVLALDLSLWGRQKMKEVR
ncbi:MAG: hypothetical protein IKF42_04615 [Mogibacterium sp.]|nr:hypothetical protein [Mogibacterium sp.]